MLGGLRPSAKLFVTYIIIAAANMASTVTVSFSASTQLTATARFAACSCGASCADMEATCSTCRSGTGPAQSAPQDAGTTANKSSLSGLYYYS